MTINLLEYFDENIRIGSFIDYILILNGIYDLSCSISILWLYNIPIFDSLSQLHPTIFASKDNSKNPVVNRLLAYWLITYGTVRFFAGLRRENSLYIIAALTYFIEGFCFEYERQISKTLINYKAIFVSIFSVALGILVLLKPLGYIK